ncbi:MAG TPA: flagellar basal body rod protein FlgB [Candidatus Saccharimonadales bacterium]|nr:flagellar basal body rod protein FlgB [Candidatus Saccharimonadales bacterium]
MLDKILFGESIPRMQQGLDAAALRQKVIADNLANVETPGFQARRVAFEELLQGRQAPHRLQLATPEPGHLAGAAGDRPVAPRVEVDTSAQLRSGVNNVDVEREMAALQRVALQHSAVAQLISNKYKLIRQAITDR